MISMKTTLIALLISVGTLVSASGASAYMACNGDGDCWHTDGRYQYDRNLHATYHNDDWYFHQKWDNQQKYHYRDYHEGRGGYRNGIWFSF